MEEPISEADKYRTTLRWVLWYIKLGCLDSSEYESVLYEEWIRVNNLKVNQCG